MNYKRDESCSRFGIQSFIDEFNLICSSDPEEVDKMKENLFDRLKRCILERLYEQQYFMDTSFDSEIHIDNHYKIIKVYFDFYTKLNEYFDVLYILILAGGTSIKKLKNKENFTNALYLEIEGEDGKKELLPFTDVNQDTRYLYSLDLGKKKMSKYNINILSQNKVDWSKNPTIKFVLDEIKKRDLEN